MQDAREESAAAVARFVSAFGASLCLVKRPVKEGEWKTCFNLFRGWL